MYCTNCGQKLDEHAKFCPNCGQPVPSQEATASDPETKKTSEDAATTSQAPAAEVQETAEDAAAHAAAASPHAESDKTTTPPPVNHEPSMSGIPAEPDGNGTIRTVGVVLLVLSILFALPQAFNTLGSFFGIFGNLFRFSLHGILDQSYSLLDFIMHALKLPLHRWRRLSDLEEVAGFGCRTAVCDRACRWRSHRRGGTFTWHHHGRVPSLL